MATWPVFVLYDLLLPVLDQSYVSIKSCVLALFVTATLSLICLHCKVFLTCLRVFYILDNLLSVPDMMWALSEFSRVKNFNSYGLTAKIMLYQSLCYSCHSFAAHNFLKKQHIHEHISIYPKTIVVKSVVVSIWYCITFFNDDGVLNIGLCMIEIL